MFVTSLQREHLLHCWSVKTDSERAAFAECLVLTPGGHLVVSDLLNKRVKVFDKTGQLIRCIGDAQGSSLRSPRGVALLSGERIAVADPQANCIKIFNKNGLITSKIEGAHIEMPSDLIIGPKKELYIATNEGSSVVCLKSERSATPLSSTSEVRMRRPGGLVLTSRGHLVVSDEQSSCIRVLDAKTLLLEQTITLAGNDLTEVGNACTPAGACVDDFGHLYVADTNNNRILVFDTAADLEVCSILHTRDWFREIRMRRDVEEMLLTLSGPVGVAVNADGDLCVLEQAGRVKVFRHFNIKPTPTPKSTKKACCTII